MMKDLSEKEIAKFPLLNSITYCDSDMDTDEDDSHEETDLDSRRTVKRRLSFQSVLLKQENNDSMLK